MPTEFICNVSFKIPRLGQCKTRNMVFYHLLGQLLYTWYTDTIVKNLERRNSRVSLIRLTTQVSPEDKFIQSMCNVELDAFTESMLRKAYRKLIK